MNEKYNTPQHHPLLLTTTATTSTASTQTITSTNTTKTTPENTSLPTYRSLSESDVILKPFSDNKHDARSIEEDGTETTRVYTRGFSHSCSFPVKESRGGESAGNNNNNIFNNRNISKNSPPHIFIEEDDDDCGELEENTAHEIIQNIRNSIYDNVPDDCPGNMLNKTLPNNVDLPFDENYFVTDLNIHVNQKMNGQRHVSSEDDDDDESISSQEECEEEEIEDEVESIRSLHHLDIPGGMPELKKPGMGSVDSGVPSSPVMRSPRWVHFC